MSDHWDTAALAAGVPVDRTPYPGAIGQTDPGVGHVAFVAGVVGGYMIIEEFNGPVPRNCSRRKVLWAGTDWEFLHFESL